MYTCIQRTCLPALVVLVALMTGGLSAAGSADQEPAQERSPLSDQDRRKAMERLMEQMRKGAEASTQPAVKPVSDQAAPAAPVVPSIVQRAPLAGGQVQLTYDNADLYDFVNQIADTLGITPIVIDPEVKGSVTIHSSAAMSKDDVFPLFNLILKNNNAALVKQGNIYQIVPISSGLKKGLEVIEHVLVAPPAQPAPEKDPAKKPDGASGTQAAPASGAPAGQTQQPPPQTAVAPAAASAAAQQPAEAVKSKGLSTHVIRAEFVPVKDLAEPIKLFMTEGGVIMPYERMNMLIVTDYGDSISKILEIIRLLDRNYLNPDLLELVKIKYNAAADVVEDLRKIFGGAKDASTGISIVSLDRLNAILINANSKRALEEVKRWIERLDATTGRTIQTYVYVVENSTASNIAMILSAIYGGEGGMTGTTAADRGAFGAGRTTSGLQGGTAGGSQFGGPSGTAGSTFGGSFSGGQSTFGTGGGAQGGLFGGFSGTTQQLGPRLNQQPGTSAQVLRGGSFTGLQDAVRIVVDDINNSLIIQASAADYAYILETIKKMDVLPRQAIIDARIFEVELTDAFSFGISAALQSRSTGEKLTTAGLSATTGALTAGTFAFIGDSRELLLALDTLRQKTKVRVLEAPSVLALDGTVARIVVGGEVPYPGASYIGAAGGATTSVQYRDTGVSLIVMPRISASGHVTLDVAHEVSTPGAPTQSGPTFNKTSVSTTLSVKDGQTVAIAGLIRDSNNWSRAGVPFFSEIPLVGALFGRTNRTANRTELLIMITPHVIRNQERLQELSQELRDSLRNVRRFVDEKEQEHVGDLEKAREERYKTERKLQKKETSPKNN